MSNKKQILLDFISLQENTEGTYNGGGEYAKIIFDKLLSEHNDLVFSAFIDSRLPLNDFVNYYQKKFNLKLFDVNKSKLNEIALKNGIDTIYSPLPYAFKSLNLSKTRFIGTIHGLRALEDIDPRTQLAYTNNFYTKFKILVKILFPNFRFNKKIKVFRNLINQNEFEFITVSNHTKFSLISFLDIDGDSVEVFYSPCTIKPLKKYISIGDLNSSLRENKFFLMVSGNRWIKNNARVIKALDELISSNYLNEFNVVVTGIKSEMPFFNKIKNKNKFIFMDYVSDYELSHLYKNCYSFIYPTLNEGFGYPPLEAMYYEKPVLASPFTSITEICGDSVIYFNPLSIYEIKNRILMILEKNIYESYVEKSIQRHNFIKKIQDEDLKKLVDFIIS